jgi:hypothetical protein
VDYDMKVWINTALLTFSITEHIYSYDNVFSTIFSATHFKFKNQRFHKIYSGSGLIWSLWKERNWKQLPIDNNNWILIYSESRLTWSLWERDKLITLTKWKQWTEFYIVSQRFSNWGSPNVSQESPKFAWIAQLP